MYIAERLKLLREAKNLSQGDIEKRTGLLRSYISRVENGGPVPSIETLEKITRALEIPMYQLFYGEEETPPLPPLNRNGKRDWTSSRPGHNCLLRITHALARMSEKDRNLLLYTASEIARRTHRNGRAPEESFRNKRFEKVERVSRRDRSTALRQGTPK